VSSPPGTRHGGAGENPMRVALADDVVIPRGPLTPARRSGVRVVGLVADGDALPELVERTRPTSRSSTSTCRRRTPTRDRAPPRRSASNGPRSARSCSPSMSTPAMRWSYCPPAPTASATCSRNASRISTNSPPMGSESGTEARCSTRAHDRKPVRSILGTLRLPQSSDDHRRVLAVITYLNSQ
jgi:hypothetical protein